MILLLEVVKNIWVDNRMIVEWECKNKEGICVIVML